MQTLLYKYTIYSMVHTNYRTIVCCTKYRIARTYLQHNTCPHTKYKQHTPYQIQNECIATIYTPNTKPWEKQHTYYTSYQIQKKLILLHQIQNIAAPRTYAKYRTLNAAPYRQNTAASNMSISVQESAPCSYSCLLIQCCTLIMCQWYEWNAITGLHCI